MQSGFQDPLQNDPFKRDPFQQTHVPFSPDEPEKRKRIPWWGWIFVVFCGAVPVVAVGGVLPVVIGMAGISACMLISRSMRSSPILGSFICFGISIACWVAFVGVLAMLIVINGGDPIRVARHLLGLENRAARPAQRVARNNRSRTRNVPPRNVQAQQPNRSPRNSSKPPLTAAIWHGDVAEVQRVLNSGVDPNVPDDDKYPLATAIELRQTAVATLLLEKGADPNLGMIRGQSLLGYAFANNGIDFFKLLVEHGAKLKEANAGYLEMAVRTDNRVLLRAVFDSGYQVSGEDASSAEHVMRSGNSEMLDVLLEHGLPVDLQLPNGQYLLHLAVIGRHPEMVQLLLKHGADPNQTNRVGETPLFQAASTGDLAVATLLVTSKAKIGEVDGMG